MSGFGQWALGTFVVCLLALIFGSFLLAFICLAVSMEIAAVLWTPLRSWLGLPEPRPDRSQRRIEAVEPDLEP